MDEVSNVPTTRRTFLGMALAGVTLFAGVSWLSTALFSSPSALPQQSPQTIAPHPATLIRQNDPAQYASDQEFQDWNGSTCSTTSMAMAINAYGYSYRVTDILSVQAAQHEITANDGLLHGHQSIAQTVKFFGFSARSLSDLGQALDAANAGKPVIVGVVGAQWPKGHILLLTGSTDTTIHLLDPWPASDLHDLDRVTFLRYWTNFAELVEPDPASVIGKPTVTVGLINQVLDAYSSPAAGKGQALFNLGVQYGIDPAFALAFFLHESSFGKNGWGAANHSLGNIRCSTGYACGGGYRAYATWEEGFHDWYELIRNLYIAQWGCTTVEEIIPHYAPAADQNDEQGYVTAVEEAVATWRSGKVVVA
jgi:hypothetical protein